MIEELFAVTRRKFPEKQKVIDRFLSDLSYEYVYTPHQMKGGLFEIRDPNDYPVLYTAVIENIYSDYRRQGFHQSDYRKASNSHTF